MKKVDLLVRNGRVVDPVNSIDGVADVALSDGKVVEIRQGMDPTAALEVIDADGALVVPGVVDSHVHLVRVGSEGVPYNMLLRRGVTTTMDMRGSIDTFVDEMETHGHGLNAACLHALVIGEDVQSENPGRDEVSKAIDKVLARGAFGIKMVGGHIPFTPEATAIVIDECAKRGAYVAFHCGTTKTGSNINGFLEAVELAAGNPLHVCHTNAYLRGQVESPLLETNKLLASLEENPHLVSESYISVMNGTSALLENGTVKSRVTQTCLKRKGYGIDKEGMGKAIKDGWARIYARIGGELGYLAPAEGYAYWDRSNTNANCSFPVNDPVAMLACATARRKDGSFTVDAISTDGGGIPRNVIFENGVHLVAMGYMSMQDLVLKSSYYPARMLGLVNKGHLTPGADADVSVFCPCSGKALYTIVGGVVRMAAGVCGTGPGVVITSEQGKKAVEDRKIPCIAPDLAESTFRKGHPKTV